MDEFLNEVVLISGMKHRNLVKLRGCCIREKQRLLVYEYVDNHDLQWVLLGEWIMETTSCEKLFGLSLVLASLHNDNQLSSVYDVIIDEMQKAKAIRL
jgi:serine/threonine protein kinase